ncbi:MAG: nitronate monooxygenase [Candidatus Hydrogenedentes bacterium]|nr:nitronate monooxygenase [Candidatus Hydrogenedentota bacterium]
MTHPTIIQGGMGAGVSGWRLARSVALEGQLGVVSGTAIASIVVRVLQSGDPEGHIARAVTAFPLRAMAERVYAKYYKAGGVAEGEPFKRQTMHTLKPSQELMELTVFASFAEVYLAKEGHDGLVGMNLLEKIVLPNLPTIYGALLADVDYIIMGAGIPLEIPGSIDKLSQHEACQLRVHVTGAEKGEEHFIHFDPKSVNPDAVAPLKRPKFLAIISSNVLALALLKRANGYIDGFVVEAPTAGGHNAPPRGKLELNDRGEPIYGEKDEVDLPKLAELGRPFWLAGSHATPEKVRLAIEHGAAGIQAGTIFALCEESGFTPEIRSRIIRALLDNKLDVFTDPLASPTGFPFKVALLQGTLSHGPSYEARPRCCDLGFLRTAYKKADGKVDYRCPSEPVDQYLKKGGEESATEGRKCLCNSLVANIGLPQHQTSGYTEQPLITIGDDVLNMKHLFQNEEKRIHSADVIHLLLSEVPGAALAHA